MNELTTWLRVQLDEDERIARAAHPKLGFVLGFVEIGSPEIDADEAHIANWDAERVLAEIAAKRAILDAYERADAAAEFPNREGGIAEGLEDAVRLLAQPYAGRDGWREEWRIDA